MKFGQLTEYNKRNIFLQNHMLILLNMAQVDGPLKL